MLVCGFWALIAWCFYCGRTHQSMGCSKFCCCKEKFRISKKTVKTRRRKTKRIEEGTILKIDPEKDYRIMLPKIREAKR
jgi:hypothetical protein